MILTFLKGIIFGIANIIPGVSGGTIAVVLNIYDKLIYSINNIFKDLKENLKFLLPLLIGAGCGIIFLSSIISYGLEYYSLPTTMLFAGLVTGSIPLIGKIATEDKKFNPMYLIFTFVAFLIVFYMSNEKNATAVVAGETNYLYLFVSGIIASSAMIIPGISGSFMMILLGVYPMLIENISLLKDLIKDPTNFTLMFEIFQVLVPIGLGIIVGVLLTSKLIEYLMKNFKSQTFFTILGLIFGSLYGLFVDPATYASGVNVTSIALGVIAFILGLVITKSFEKK
ncbi:MAG: DUF368 domain-containing protein [Lachnospirales bacterium]